MASSQKTLDTQTAARLNNLGSIESAVKKYADRAADEDRDFSFSGTELGQQNITKRVIELAVPPSTNSSQMKALKDAAAYAKKQGVELNLHFAK